MKQIQCHFNRYTFARLAIFVVYFWFGILKVFMLSHANPLVLNLLHHTFLNFIPDHSFIIILGIFEMLIGVLALVKKCTKVFFTLMVLHLTTTILPLFILLDVSWSQFWVPTLVGQYILKNLVLLALAYIIYREDAS